MKRISFFFPLIVVLLAGCGGDEPPVEEYVQDPRATAGETPDVTELLGRPANDPATAVDAFILALKLGEGEKLQEIIYPGGEGEAAAPLLKTMDDLLAGPGISGWDEVTVGRELPAGENLLESREVSVRIFRPETSRVLRFTVVRSNVGWYIWDIEG
ncbi:hypothetical protein KAU45_00025 [bacterium]|nr:hypothetical protein [bacterium]